MSANSPSLLAPEPRFPARSTAAATGGLFWLLAMFALTFGDYLTRGRRHWLPPPRSIRRRWRQHRIGPINFWKKALQLADLRQIVKDDIRVVRVLH